MKIFLYNPPFKEYCIREGRCQSKINCREHSWFPLSPAYCCKYLNENGFEAFMKDYIVIEGIPKDVLSDIKKISPEIVVVSISTITFFSDIDILRSIKKQNPNVFIAVIGVHCSALPEDCLKNDCIDFVILGEPEETVLELCRAIKSGKDLKKISGLAFRFKKKVVVNKRKGFIKNIDKYGFATSDLIDSKYISPRTYKPYAMVQTSRGCPFNCVFCTTHKYYGNYLRSRDYRLVADEIELLKNKGFKEFHLHSDTFTCDKKWLGRFLCELGKRRLDIEWFATTRSDSLSRSVLLEMKRRGCRMISMGFESGNQKVLNKSCKGLDIRMSKKISAMCKKINIIVLGYFIFGLPGETFKTMTQTLEFAKKIDPSFASFFTAVPFPGSKLFELGKQKGLIRSFDWRKYSHEISIMDTENLYSEQIMRFRKYAEKNFYTRPVKVLNLLKDEIIMFDKIPLLKYSSKQALNFIGGKNVA